MNMNKVGCSNQENHTYRNTNTYKIQPINLPDAPQFLIEISPMSIMLSQQWIYLYIYKIVIYCWMQMKMQQQATGDLGFD